MMMPNDRDEWTLRFRPTGPDTRPTAVRVRQLLKHALRTCGLRCTGTESTGSPVGRLEDRESESDVAGPIDGNSVAQDAAGRIAGG